MIHNVILKVVIGEKQGDVIPENILKIEHIENYEKIMSQCLEFHDFYN